MIDILKKSKNMAVEDEPIEKWEEGENLLSKVYEDPIRWGFVFQTNVLLTLW